MAVYRRGETYWYSFIFAGRRIQESAKTHSKTVAKLAEKKRHRELEESFNAIESDKRADRLRTVAQACATYRKGYESDHAPRSAAWVRDTLQAVEQRLGGLLIAELTEERIKAYMTQRKGEGLGNRRINMEVGNLSRAVGSKWTQLWPKLRKLKEPSDVGRALSQAEESALRRELLACESNAARTAVFVALNTGMRSDEIKAMQWRQIDFGQRILTVGEAKTKAGTGRQIPLNPDVLAMLDAHRGWYIRRFGAARPEWYLLPAGQRGRKADKSAVEDPTKPIGSFRKAWEGIRERAKVDCRFHDLRHTVCTKMAENGVPESTMLAIMGHMSRAMLERYSHIRITAKREAVEGLRFNADSTGVSTVFTTSTNKAKTDKTTKPLILKN